MFQNLGGLPIIPTHVSRTIDLVALSVELERIITARLSTPMTADGVKYQTAEAKAERIIAEELRRRTWTESDLALRRKGDPAKLALASRLRSETILPMTWIARRLHLGTARSARPRLRTWQRNERASSSNAGKPPSLNQDDTTEGLNVALL